jgi:hypothetical protein
MEKWRLFKRIRGLCHSHGGIIFGGSVRDAYIHDHDARKFYQKYGDTGTDTESEFSGRFVVPNDIDCFMMEENHKKFLQAIQHRYHVRVIMNVDADYLTTMDIPPGQSQYIRYSILEIIGDRHVEFQLDMLVQLQGEELMIPVNLDMDVNALLWTKDSIHLNPSFLPLLGIMYGISSRTSLGTTVIYTALFENIMSKKAQCTPNCSSHRILKMKKKRMGRSLFV